MTIVESVLQVFVLAAAAIATLRAGSRAMYSATSNKELGMMDGPLVLSPFDVKELERRNDQHHEVSPLWELTFGFSEAVRLLHDGHDSINDDCLDIKETSWSEESNASGYYLSSPHKDRINHEFKVQKSVMKESIDLIQKDYNGDNGDGSTSKKLIENQSLIISTPEKTIIFPKTSELLGKATKPYYFFLKKLIKFSSQIQLLLSFDNIQSVRKFSAISETMKWVCSSVKVSDS